MASKDIVRALLSSTHTILEASNPVLLDRQRIEVTNMPYGIKVNHKIGDGITAYRSLPFLDTVQIETSVDYDLTDVYLATNGNEVEITNIHTADVDITTDLDVDLLKTGESIKYRRIASSWKVVAQGKSDYTEISAATTAPESVSTENVIQYFRNTHTAGVVLTLGTSGKTIDMIPDEVAIVVYNGTTWYQLNDLIESTDANDKVLNFAADASLLWDESEDEFVLNKRLQGTLLDLSGALTCTAIDTGLGANEVYNVDKGTLLNQTSTSNILQLPAMSIGDVITFAGNIQDTNTTTNHNLKLPTTGTFNWYGEHFDNAGVLDSLSIRCGTSIAGGTTVLQTGTIGISDPSYYRITVIRTS